MPPRNDEGVVLSVLRQVQQKQDVMHVDVGEIKTGLALLEQRQARSERDQAACQLACAGYRGAIAADVAGNKIDIQTNKGAIAGAFSRSLGWKDTMIFSSATAGFVFVLLKIWQALFPAGGPS